MLLLNSFYFIGFSYLQAINQDLVIVLTKTSKRTKIYLLKHKDVLISFNVKKNKTKKTPKNPDSKNNTRQKPKQKTPKLNKTKKPPKTNQKTNKQTEKYPQKSLFPFGIEKRKRETSQITVTVHDQGHLNRHFRREYVPFLL